MQVLCDIEDIDPESGKEVLIQAPGGKRYVALFRVAGGVQAYLNTCPHQGRSLNWAPDRFLIGDDGALVCPHHGACFDLNTGICISGPCERAELTPVAIQVEDGKVYLPDS